MLGFPSNDFGKEEPGTDAEIKAFATGTYGVTFPLFAKIPVKRPAPDSPYFYLAEKAGPPRWNFHKYLLDRDGQFVRSFDPKISPDAPELRAAIESLLDR